MAKKKKDKDKEEEKAKDRDDDKPKSKGKAATAERVRPRNDAYVMMLFITLVAIAAGSFLMYKDHEEYGSKQPPKEAVPPIQKLGEATKAAPAPAGGGGGAAGGGGGAPMGGAGGGDTPMGMMP